MAMGGLSGSPAYAMTENGLRLCGFVNQGITPNDSIVLTHAALIKHDGTISK
jgi:hypothetical protein